jgi:phage terminase small subunit
MTIRSRYLISFFALLTLVGFCDCYTIYVSNVNHLKQTEWVSKLDRNAKKANCYFLSFRNVPDQIKLSWSKLSIEIFNQKITVVFLSEIKLFIEFITINQTFKDLYNPRLAIDGDAINCMKEKISNTEIIAINHSKLTRWISIKKLNGKGKDALSGYPIGFL